MGASYSSPGCNGVGGAKSSDLPPELLRLISAKLANISDYVRFRSVCSRWRSAIDRPPQVPLLLLPLHSAASAATVSILNLSDGKLYTSAIPHSHRSLISASPGGYLVELSLDEPAPTVTLFNLLTRTQTHVVMLPPLPSAMRPPYVTKAFLTSKRDVLIAVWALECNLFAFWRQVRSERSESKISWQVVEVDDPYCSEDFLYLDGAFYFTNGTVAVDSSPRNLIKLDRPSLSWPCRSCHLVESSGDVLLVARSAYSTRFEVFKFDKSGKPKWLRVERGRMGDTALFLSAKQSVSASSSSSGWRGNSVYYADEDYLVARIRSFDIDGEEEDKPYSWVAPSSHRTNSLDSSGVTWFLPSLV